MIVLDTHAWIWFINSPDELGEQAAAAIGEARESGEGLHVSCISTWEIHMLAAKGRLSLDIAPEVWVARCEKLSFLRFHAINNIIARMSVNDCANMHTDPADRMIVATALYLGATIVTRDSKIQTCGLVKSTW